MSQHSRQPSITSSIISASNHSHPQKIGPWKLGKTLGRGATGRVLLATHQTTGQKAAVKVVSKSELQENEGSNKKSSDEAGLPYGIEREIIIMKLLTHPNVLRLYDVWETSKALYLVLEYVEGGELFDLLVERGPLQEIEAIKYFRQIILGTAYCHALGICHRDLKPENLLLDASLNVKLADFGMAALESNGKLLETSCGSPHYAAPEIVSGLKYHGAASDVWSCGVILFALLTGRLPFDDENIRNLLLKVQAGNFQMPDEISHEAKHLISLMLTVDPMKRISTEKVLAHPLLNKYPIPNEDLISVKSLPHPETAYKSLGSVKNIDRQILANLSILWHDRPQQDIIHCLLTNGSNPEKTFYALLMRYRHNQSDSGSNSPKKSHSFNAKRGMVRSGSTSNKNTPRKKVGSQISASRRSSFQYKNGSNYRGSYISTTGKVSAPSSVQNSPRKSPRKYSYNQSPGRSPYKSPNRSSPRRSPRKSQQNYYGDSSPPPAIPRNIYNEIVTAQKNGSLQSMPPPLPSKDSHLAGRTYQYNYQYDDQNNKPHQVQDLKYSPEVGKANPIVDEISSQDLLAYSTSQEAPTTANKRESVIKKSNSKNRLSRRRSLRASMTSGLKRNSITMKLLSTYAKLSGESDWEYMDKQTKRTSATFATLCDKIFNQEQYDEEDENLIDEEEKEAREYERLMEIERKKHEAEMRARKELEKKRRRQKRKSLLSSKKLSIMIKDDGENNSELDITKEEAINQPKRGSKSGLRTVSENDKDHLTKEDVEKLKLRSVTQPAPNRRQTPILTRRPVSRLDPLWHAYENEELTRAKEALDAELADSQRAKDKKKKNRDSVQSRNVLKEAKGKNRESMVHRDSKYKNRESVISVMDDRRMSRDSYYNNRLSKYELPDPQVDDSELSEEYMSEIRKSRLLNSQVNIHGMVEEDKVPESPGPKTLISNVKIPTVTRKSRHFSNSNKRLSVLSMYSTKESYKDLNSVLNSTEDAHMPNMRTSFADRLDKAGLPEEDGAEEPLDEGSILDLEDHLANKRTSYFSQGNRASKYGNKLSQRPTSELPQLPNDDEELDETFVTKHEHAHRRKSNGSRNQGDDEDVFDNIRLPDSGSGPAKPKTNNHKSMLPSAQSMLIPDASKLPKTTAKSQPYPKVRQSNTTQNGDGLQIHTTIKKPLEDATNRQDPNQRRNRSIFRKLSWGSKKALDTDKPTQLPSPAESRSVSVEERPKSPFFRWFSSSSSSAAHNDSMSSDVKRYKTILPKQEMSTALYALLNSWSNFGIKNLKNDLITYTITGGISSANAFNLKSCKFRIKIDARDQNQKSEIVCAKVKGSKVTTDTLFKEIEKVLRKEGVMDV